MAREVKKVPAYVPIIVILMLIIPGGYESFAGETLFTPSFEIVETYHENVFYLNSEREDDFIVSLIANFPFKFSSPSKTFTLSYSPFAEFYREHDSLNYVGHKFRSIYNYKGKTSDLSISEFFTMTQGQGEVLDYRGFPIGVLSRTDILSNYFNVLYELRIKKSSFLNVDIGHGIKNYDDLPGIDYVDTTTFSFDIENLYAVRNIKNRVGYFYNCRKIYYETTLDRLLNTIGFVYKYEHARKLNVTIKAGVFKVQESASIQSGKDTAAIFYFNLSKYFRRGNITFVLSRNAGTSGGFGGLSLNNRAFLGSSYKITRLLSFRASSEYYKRVLIEEGYTGYDAFAIGSSFDYKIHKKLSITWGHRYFNQNSEDDDFDSRFNVYFIGLKIYPFQKSF